MIIYTLEHKANTTLNDDIISPDAHLPHYPDTRMTAGKSLQEKNDVTKVVFQPKWMP